jgi:hypothetical protein
MFQLLTSFGLLFAALNVEANYSNEQFEKSLYDIGFKEVNKAIDDAELHYQKDLALPVQLPPIPLCHFEC